MSVTLKKNLMLLKPLPLLALYALITLGCKDSKKPSHSEHQHHREMKKEGPSSTKGSIPRTFAMTLVDGAHIHIDYSAPNTNGKVHFGETVPYGEIWQAGAGNATWFETNKDLLIKGKVLKAGRYGFFTIPSEAEWTVIFNSIWEQNGTEEYNPNEDILRFKLKPEMISPSKEKLTYQVKQTGDREATISLSWSSISIRFKALVN